MALPSLAAIGRLLDEIGPRWADDIRSAGDLVKAAYLPLLAAAPKQGVDVVRDIAYGDHPRQRLDLYLPARPVGAAPVPVVLFVHGGAFVRGERDINAEMYGNVLIWFARQGFIGVNVEYRLAPEASYPAGADDVARACAWVRSGIAPYGGDPRRLCLIGHSAGGTHAASYAFDPALGYDGRDIRCLVLISARLRADVLPHNPNAHGVRAYFGEATTRYDAMSPVTHAARSSMPTLIAVAEYENPLLDVYGLELAYRIAVARQRAPRFLIVPRHNHVSIMAHFNAGEHWLGDQIVAFIGACCNGAPA